MKEVVLTLKNFKVIRYTYKKGVNIGDYYFTVTEDSQLIEKFSNRQLSDALDLCKKLYTLEYGVTKKELISQTRKELELIRENITDEEKNRLIFSNLNPFGCNSCIYALIDGNSYSGVRARELRNLCGKPYSRDTEDFEKPLPRLTETSMCINFTFMEFYICQKYAKNKNVINYLTGKTDTLNL